MSTTQNGFDPRRMLKLREERGLSQAQLGEKVGVSATTIGYWETARHNPSISKLVKLASVLGTSRAYLTGNSNDPIPQNPIHSGTNSTQSLPDQPRPLEIQGDARLQAHAKQLMEFNYLASPNELLTWLLRQSLSLEEVLLKQIESLRAYGPITRDLIDDILEKDKELRRNNSSLVNAITAKYLLEMITITMKADEANRGNVPTASSTDETTNFTEDPQKPG